MNPEDRAIVSENIATHDLWDEDDPDAPQPVREWGASLCKDCNAAEIETHEPCPHVFARLLG